MAKTNQQPVRLSVSENLSTDLDPGARGATDSCPGAVRMFRASDGLIGRIRMPGGRVGAADWERLAQLAEEFGDGDIHLTSRGNLQVRGISDQAGFVAMMSAHGYLPSVGHDLVRNVLASPLDRDLDELIDALDAAILASPTVGGCSGRTLFGLDGGDGAIIAQRPDFAVLQVAGDFHLVLAGVPTGHRVARADVAAVLVGAAEQWQRRRGAAWRLAERPELIPELTAALGPLLQPVAPTPLPEVSARPAPIGWLADGERVSLGAGLRFGQLSSRLARFLAAIGAQTRVTPWNSLVIHDLSEAVAEQVVKVLAPMGLIFDAHSPWLLATACTGLPGCGKSHGDVRADLVHLIDSGQLAVGAPTHFVGCARRCGHPMHPHVEYQATPESEYEIFDR